MSNSCDAVAVSELRSTGDRTASRGDGERDGDEGHRACPRIEYAHCGAYLHVCASGCRLPIAVAQGHGRWVARRRMAKLENPEIGADTVLKMLSTTLFNTSS